MQTEQMARASQLANDYLSALSSGDFDEVARLLVDDFSFRGPLAQADGRDEFIAGASQMKPIVRGHRTLRQWEDGGEVCTVYDFHIETPVGAGSVLMSEWMTVRDGKLASSRLIYDTAAWNALMPSN